MRDLFEMIKDAAPPKIDPNKYYSLEEILGLALGKPEKNDNGTSVYNFSQGTSDGQASKD